MARVYVVDDDPAIIEVIEIILKEEGHTVGTNPGHAIEEGVVAFNPDIVLLDIWMPGLDGREVAENLRKQDGDHYAIILMSAHSSVRSAVKPGVVDDFLEKPFDMQYLLDMVARLSVKDGKI